MTDLDTRLRALGEGAPSGPPPRALRKMASGRRRRRRALAGAAMAALAALGAGAAVVAIDDDPPPEVRTGPGPSTSTTEAPSPTTEAPGSTTEASPPGGVPGTRTLGDVDGVTVTVTPRTGLRDGDLVEVRVDGLERLPDAKIALCRGDVTADTAASTACDLDAVQRDGAPQAPAEVVGTVAVPRTIRAAGDPNQPEPYDCATEPPGCVLAVAPYEVPVRAVLVPISFADIPLPTPTMAVTPSKGLADGEEVTVSAEGLRPNTGFPVRLCSTGEEERCDELEQWPRATTDGRGSLRTTVTVRAALYWFGGQIDCTAEPCSVAVYDDGGLRLAAVPLTLGDEVVAPVPELSIDLPGPYVDDQVVTLSGTGFPPGFDVGRWIGQCPNDKDTAVEERCTYPSAFAPVTVGADGRFSMEVRLSASLMFTGSCVTGPGCHLGWVLNHGPTVAKAFLEFEG